MNCIPHNECKTLILFLLCKVFSQLKDLCGSLELHLIEASSKMAALQYNTLTGTSEYNEIHL